MSGTGDEDTELFDSLAGVEAGDGWLLPWERCTGEI